MASEEDNFDIDIYGDGGEDFQQETDPATTAPEEPIQVNSTTDLKDPGAPPNSTDPASSSTAAATQPAIKQENGLEGSDVAQKIASTDESAPDPVQLPKQAPQTQGVKRKGGEADDRFVDAGATTALYISDLHWWVNDDDVRGWANQSQCEDELENITFSEHKVNGKSKGQAYVLFETPQAATAAKHKIESFGEGQQYTKKFTVGYTNPFTNPFRTLPKDGPMRNSGPSNNNRSTSTGYGGTGAAGMNGASQSGFSNSGGYRGGRGGGYNNRGGGTNNMSGYNRGGFQEPMPSFQAPMGGFPTNPMGNMGSYGGFQNRGGMMGGMRGGAMGMRGGRGGMMGMPMSGMGMGAMGMGMNMPQIGGMGMPGMPGSSNRSHTISTHAPGPYSAPAPSASAALRPMQQIPLNSMVPPSQQRGRAASGNSANPGCAWAQYTKYSQPPSTNPPINLHRPPLASHTVAQAIDSTLRRTLSTGQGFQGNQTHYNPAMFNAQLQGQLGASTADATWNPHGAKRPRQD